MARGKRAQSPEEIKQALKEEIIRLGISDNPSRTIYQKEYHRGEAPSPNNVLKVTGEKWSDIVHELGFDYDGRANTLAMARANGKKNKGGELPIRLNDPAMRSKIIARTLELMHKKNIVRQMDLAKIMRQNVGISFRTLSDHGYPFEKLKQLYAERYGEVIRGAGNWSAYANEELLALVIRTMKKNNIATFSQYETFRRASKEELPSDRTLVVRFNMKRREISKMIQALL